MDRVIIVGAGLVGSVLAVYLTRRGYSVDVFERYADIRQADVQAGRSINLTLCDRGFKVLDDIGVGGSIRDISVPAYGRLVHPVEGELMFQPYGNNQEAIYSISRFALNKTLINFAEQKFDVRFHFNKKCLGLDLSNTEIRFEDVETKSTTLEKAARIFGADGLHSAVRMQLQKTDRFNYSQQYWEQGYKELDIPPTHDGQWALEKNALHFWPRGQFMLIGFPNVDGSFTCSLHIPFEGERSFESIKSDADLLTFFGESFPDAIALIPDLVDSYFSRPPNSMATIRCTPWTFQDKVALIGDAAHALLPSYGQGANAGFEDCLVLDQCIEKHPDDWKAIFAEYEEARKPDTDAIADLCIEHFIEIRDFVGDPDFLLTKEIERRVNQLYPQLYSPLYSMITFSYTPYAEALRVEREQRIIIERIKNIKGIQDKLYSPEIRQILDSIMNL